MAAPNFYIFHGDDDLAIEAAVNKIRDAMLAQPNGEFNTSQLDGQQTNAIEVIAAISAYPFLADQRLVIVRGLLAHITRKGAGETGKKQVEYLLDTLPKLPDYARLVFMESQPLPSESKLLGLSGGQIKLYAPPTGEGPIIDWITKRAKERYQTPIQRRAAEVLAEVTSTINNFKPVLDQRRADSELFKLTCYTEGAEITEKDVLLLTPYQQEANLFEMVEALANGQTQRASTLLHHLLDVENQEPFAVFGMVVRQFRLLLLVKEHIARKGTAGIVDALKTHGIKSSYTADKFSNQSRHFSLERLERVYRLLAEFDHDIKIGKLEPILALDMLVARLVR
jgi:DNA polymerase III subunit delta